jgi:hypothetical protein
MIRFWAWIVLVGSISNVFADDFNGDVPDPFPFGARHQATPEFPFFSFLIFLIFVVGLKSAAYYTDGRAMKGRWIEGAMVTLLTFPIVLFLTVWSTRFVGLFAVLLFGFLIWLSIWVEARVLVKLTEMEFEEAYDVSVYANSRAYFALVIGTIGYWLKPGR